MERLVSHGPLLWTLLWSQMSNHSDDCQRAYKKSVYDCALDLKINISKSEGEQDSMGTYVLTFWSDGLWWELIKDGD